MSFALSFIVSLHDALPIWRGRAGPEPDAPAHHRALRGARAGVRGPRGGGRGRRGGPGRLLCAAAGGAGGGGCRDAGLDRGPGLRGPAGGRGAVPRVGVLAPAPRGRGRGARPAHLTASARRIATPVPPEHGRLPVWLLFLCV